MTDLHALLFSCALKCCYVMVYHWAVLVHGSAQQIQSNLLFLNVELISCSYSWRTHINLLIIHLWEKTLHPQPYLGRLFAYSCLELEWKRSLRKKIEALFFSRILWQHADQKSCCGKQQSCLDIIEKNRVSQHCRLAT